ncbi:MAG: gliding motility lipoprotein GldH [Lentimicrobium sp.]|jgi:gliding motility-associated lipoprotein GldH|nr:gliding motility lipoprotein GldH [Lentimicrobium sp.]
MKKIPGIVIMCTLLLLGCQRNKVYEHYNKFENYTWSRFDKVRFDIPIEQAGTEADIIFMVRHITQYPYDNLPVSIILLTPSGEERILEKEIKIKDEKGDFIGDGAGDLWDVQETLWPKFYFTEAGTYTIEFENIIPRPGIPGLMDIGIKVIKRK